MRRRYKTEYTAGTFEILHQSQQVNFPYITEVSGTQLVVIEEVFSPRFFHDTELFADHMDIATGERVLEIGPGTGAIIIKKKLEGAGRAVAIDINPEAVRCTTINALLNKAEIEMHEGNLFEPLEDTDQFEVIFWNTPFALVPEGTQLTKLQLAVADPEYRATSAFIAQAKKHLAPDGRLVLGFSSTLGHYRELKKILKENGYMFRETHRFASQEVKPVYFVMIEARLE